MHVTAIPRPMHFRAAQWDCGMGKRLLHVEPNASERTRFAQALEGTRYDAVVGAETADDAVALIEELRPDIVVLSLATLGGQRVAQSGPLELLSNILSRPRPPLVVVSHPPGTGHLWPEARRRGAAAAVNKHASRKDLLEALRNAETFRPGVDPLRRKRVRLRVCLIGWYKKPGDGFFKKMQPANVEDISGDGLGLNTVEAIPQGASLKLNLQLPNLDKPIRANAEVVWSRLVAEDRTYRLGLRFTKMSDEAHAALDAYIQKRLAAE